VIPLPKIFASASMRSNSRHRGMPQSGILSAEVLRNHPLSADALWLLGGVALAAAIAVEPPSIWTEPPTSWKVASKRIHD